jgi:hypothetical protein
MMKYFYVVLATVFGLSFVWSVAAAKERAVETPATKSRQVEKRLHPACKTDQHEKTGSKRPRNTCRKADAEKSAGAYRRPDWT